MTWKRCPAEALRIREFVAGHSFNTYKSSYLIQSRVVDGTNAPRVTGHAFRSPNAMEGMVAMREISLDFLTLLARVLWHHRTCVAKYYSAITAKSVSRRSTPVE